MILAETLDVPVQAAIAAADEGVGLSLLCLLEACGLRGRRVDGAAALAELPFEPLEAVLLDWSLLEMAGPAAIAQLRSAGWRGLAIIMTENEAIPAELRAIRPEIGTVLAKPFAAQDLIALLDRPREIAQAQSFAIGTGSEPSGPG